MTADEGSRRRTGEHGASPQNQLRAHERHSVSWPGTLRSDTGEQQVVVTDISADGFFLATPAELPSGTQIEVTLELPGEGELTLTGTVRRVVSPSPTAPPGASGGLGISADAASRSQLSALCEKARQQRPRAPQPARREPVPPTAPPLQPGTPAAIIGIDVGACHSRVAATVDDAVVLIPDERNRLKIPSLVGFPESGPPVMGWEAWALQGHHPQRVIPSTKRLLGRRFSDKRVAEYLRRLPVPSSPGDDDEVLFHIDDRRLAAPEICALLLGYLCGVAGKHLDTTLRKAVVTVPLGFDEPQCAALHRAAALADVEIVATIEEPVASAMAHGCGHRGREVVALYDFGGGTFTFAVFEMTDGGHRLLASAGDAWLGGEDFDVAMADAVANAFWRRTDVELRSDPVERQRLLIACEKTKRELSQHDDAEVRVPEIVRRPSPLHLVQPVDRFGFRRICVNLLDESLELCEEALETAGLTVGDLTTLVVTGGTSQIPFVHAGLERFFERRISDVIDPEHAIAFGAGMHAARLAGRSEPRIHPPGGAATRG